MYASMYVMERTTVYLPEDLKFNLRRTAQSTGRSEADLIREGVRQVVAAYDSPHPRIPLFRSGQSTLAEGVDENLEGFGED